MDKKKQSKEKKKVITTLYRLDQICVKFQISFPGAPKHRLAQKIRQAPSAYLQEHHSSLW